ncbi:probable pterin-4-alpha-carbinolamine dehydratase, chloroplastic [Nymphaea colorata]|nr:probable pterin-4-alpha-carbinolamine dehydratase, chloroplastic [Nymphaea colorata]
MAAHLYSIPAPTLPSTTLRRPLAGAGARVATGWGTELGRRDVRLVGRAAAGSDILGDIGARDPFPQELESNFCDRVIGNANTEHQILVPVSSALSLWNQECRPLSPSDTPFSYDDAQNFLRKVVGWRLVDKDGTLRLHCLWKLKDSASSDELVSRIRRAVGHTGHCPEFFIENSTHVTAELWSSSIGGLSMNDFIIAAKIDRVKTSDLLPKKRVWA